MKALYPHQEKAKDLILENQRYAIFHDPGLGKTLIALSALRESNLEGVVVCPNSAKLVWKEENEEMGTSIRLENYTSFHTLKPSDIKGKMLISDEAHYLKSIDSQRSNKFYELAQYAEKIVLLTGTPCADKPLDTFMLLVLLGLRSLKSFWSFRQEYCYLKQKTIRIKGGRLRRFQEVVGYKNLKDLRKELDQRADFKKLSEVESMPPANFFIQPVNLTPYDLSFYKENKSKNPLVNLHLCSKLNITSVVDKVKEILEGSGEKLVIFSFFKDTVKELGNQLGSPYLTGESSVEERGKRLEDFNASGRIFLSTFGTGKESLNLQAASYMFLVDLPQYLLDFSQALRRIYRIGQIKPVFYYVFSAKGTQMERVITLLNEKFKLTTKVFPENIDFDILSLFGGS